MSRRRSGRAALWAGVVVLAMAAASPVFAATAAQPAAVPGEQRIPFKREADGTSALLARVVGGLVVVVLLGFGAVYAIKRYFPSLYHPSFSGSTRIKLIEARRLTTRTTLFLIELDGVSMLVAQTADRVTLLHERPRTDSTADRT